MPITVVQTAPSVQVQSLSGTLTATFSNPTGSGNSLVACITTAASVTCPTVSGLTLGGSGDNWEVANSDPTTAGLTSTIWYDPGCSSGKTVVVLSFTGGSGVSGDVYLTVYEVTGVLAFDKGSSGNVASGASTFSSGTTATTTAANEIFFGSATATNVIPTVTGVGSWTTQSTGAGQYDQIAGYQIVSSTGTATYSGTVSSSGYTAIVATFNIPPHISQILDEAGNNILDQYQLQILDEAATQTAPVPFGPPYNSYDVTQITPGGLWLRLFKPAAQHPFWPMPYLFVGQDASSGHFALAPLGFTAQGGVTIPDLPQINPGGTWFDLFKPWFVKPRPVPPVQPSVLATGSFKLAPLVFLGSEGFAFFGHFSVSYPDYIDNTIGHTLTAVPGGFYMMSSVSSRAGMVIPPPDGRWQGEQSFGAEVIMQHRAVTSGPRIHFTLITTPSPERFAALTRRGIDATKERRELAITLSSTFTNALLSTASSGVATQIGGGTLVIYTGTGPAGPNEAATGTILATFTFSAAGSQGAPSGGSMTLSFVANTVTAGNTGTAGYFRIISSGAVALIQGAVGVAGSDWNLSSVLINSGDSVSITGTPTISWTVA